MLNELLLRLNRPQDLPFQRQSIFGEGSLPGLLASLGNNQPPQSATEEGMKDMAVSAEASKVLQGTTGGGISGWLRRSSQDGGLLNRIGDFGLAVQDATDGGNRSERLRAERVQQQQFQAAQQHRMQLNQMLNTLDLTPQERFLALASPDSFGEVLENRLGDRTLGNQVIRNGQPIYTAPEEAQTYNTRDGLVRVGPNGAAEVVYKTTPDAPNGFRYNGDGLEYIPGGPADPTYASRLAGSRRAPRASGGGNGRQVGGASSYRPSGNTSARPPWERDY
jgi:hypothetical protein